MPYVYIEYFHWIKFHNSDEEKTKVKKYTEPKSIILNKVKFEI